MKLLICNLKAHKTYAEMFTYCEHIKKIEYPNLIIAPSNVYLPLFQNLNCKLCAQNIDLNANLYLTGDTSIEALKSLNVKYIIIGHYERQKYYHETNDIILTKIKLALNNNFKVIYCIGEEKNCSNPQEYLTKNLDNIFSNIINSQDIIIAYEPTYLIGGNSDYNLNNIQNNLNYIKNYLKDKFKIDTPVVFGGNINLENIHDFLQLKNLEGFIIGNTSQDSQNIPKILDIMTKENI